MKQIIFISSCIILTTLTSCRKTCRVCECERGGQKFTEKNCAVGSAGKKNLDTWEKYLKEEKKYDVVICKDER